MRASRPRNLLTVLRRAPVLALAMLALCASPLSAQPDESVEPPATRPATAPATQPSHDHAQDPPGDRPGFGNDQYCGLWSLYAAGRLHGLTLSFESLLDPNWVDGTGSSLAQLQELAARSGLQGDPFGGWTKWDLSACPHPVILHVNSDPAQERYQHWVLWTGIDGDDALIVNGPSGISRVPMKELSLVWDGRGMVVRPVESRAFMAWPRWWLLAGVALTAGFGGWLVPRLRGSRAPRPGLLRAGMRVGVQICAIVAAAGMVTAGQAVLAGEGLLVNRPVTDRVAEAHLVDFLPKIGLEEMRRLASDPDVIIVDARLPQDYEAGHIEGSFNVPVGSLDAGTLAALEQRGRDKRVVIYCQSRWCEYDEFTARSLIAAGFTDITLFPGGWRDWKGAE